MVVVVRMRVENSIVSCVCVAMGGNDGPSQLAALWSPCWDRYSYTVVTGVYTINKEHLECGL